jgi:AraC-like DNA-binding protein
MYREFRPARRLVPFVECGWLRSGSAGSRVRVIPDGCVDVFVTGQGDVMIAGPASTFYDSPTGDQNVVAGLRLRTGDAPTIIGCSASEVTNIRVPLGDALGVYNTRISENICGAATPSDRISLLTDLVTSSFAAADPMIDRPITHAIGMLRTRPDTPVAELAAGVDLSERQLRRRFQVAVGYGPKRLGRVFRIQRLLDLVHACHGRTAWSELAIMAGYTDQSHMINECVALTGGPPTALPGAR